MRVSVHFPLVCLLVVTLRCSSFAIWEPSLLNSTFIALAAEAELALWKSYVDVYRRYMYVYEWVTSFSFLCSSLSTVTVLYITKVDNVWGWCRSAMVAEGFLANDMISFYWCRIGWRLWIGNWRVIKSEGVVSIYQWKERKKEQKANWGLLL